LLLFFEVKHALWWLIQLLIEEDVEVSVDVIEEILHEATIKDVTMDI